MRVLVTGHKGFIGRHVYADWQEQIGDKCVDGIDIPDDVANFNGGDYDLVCLLYTSPSPRDS